MSDKRLLTHKELKKEKLHKPIRNMEYNRKQVSD